jgi:hypothetical protein
MPRHVLDQQALGIDKAWEEADVAAVSRRDARKIVIAAQEGGAFFDEQVAPKAGGWCGLLIAAVPYQSDPGIVGPSTCHAALRELRELVGQGVGLQFGAHGRGTGQQLDTVPAQGPLGIEIACAPAVLVAVKLFVDISAATGLGKFLPVFGQVADAVELIKPKVLVLDAHVEAAPAPPKMGDVDKSVIVLFLFRRPGGIDEQVPAIGLNLSVAELVEKEFATVFPTLAAAVTEARHNRKGKPVLRHRFLRLQYGPEKRYQYPDTPPLRQSHFFSRMKVCF